MRLAPIVLLSLLSATQGRALDSPWISDTFFYWYTWDYDKELGGWINGVHNTPLDGYYDSRTFTDNRRSLWQAAEWGLTHHWIDYWGHAWDGENGEPRERTVLRACEDVAQAGYDAWMGYYQDGENFEMTEFSKNVSEKRDVYDWLRLYASSPVWAKHNGKPYQLVYSRNGAPKTTLDHKGFRRFLRQRWPTLDRLNEEWGTRFESFGEIDMDFGATGHQRAFSIKYQYERWRQEWAKLDGLVRREFGYPGMRASFDVAYQPYLGFGYSDFARVLGGPHSYGGIFDAPESQDVERFIQAAVAKRYDTVFFDHFKNFYHDWDLRVPGSAFLPEPHHFDRFWVGALMRYSEALLHLSWNEWWEGSNLEPCQEWGKTFCEKNLFYATLMKRCFPSLHEWSRGAKVAVLLNDWNWLSGGRGEGEIYHVIQGLRHANVPFDLLPDDFVTADELAEFQFVVAPAAGTGFGYNAEGQAISNVLVQWVRANGSRKLMVSQEDKLAAKLGIEAAPRPAAAATKPGADLNVFVDVGVEGDERFLLSGMSQRENWGKLPPGSFGAGLDLTCRWTPAAGRATDFVLPVSPQRQHVLRLQGSALWGNTVEAVLNGKRVGEITIRPGVQLYELPIPAATIGNAVIAELRLVYQQKNVPQEKDAERFPTEGRVCNLAIDWLQLSTDNIAVGETKQHYSLPTSRVAFLASPLPKGATVTTVGLKRLPAPVTAEGATVLSRYSLNGSARDLLLRVGEGTCWYVNGAFGELESLPYRRALLAWAGAKPRGRVAGEGVFGTFLRAGDTTLALVRTEEQGESRTVSVTPPPGVGPVSSVTNLSRDGAPGRSLSLRNGQFHDQLKHYGVYEIARSPLLVEVPELVFQLGETRTVPFRLKNVSSRPVTGSVQVTSVIPTITGDPATLARPLRPRRWQTLPVSVTVQAAADWGRKTVAIRVDCDGRTAWLFRPLTVLRQPELATRPAPSFGGQPRVSVTNRPTRHGRTATAANVSLSAKGEHVLIGDIKEGQTVTVAVPESFRCAQGKRTTVMVSFQTASGVHVLVEPLYIDGCRSAFPAMAGALLPINACNPLDHAVENWPVSLTLPRGLPEGAEITVRDEQGVAVPAQLLSDGRVCFAASMPAHTSRTHYLIRTETDVKSDLRAETEALGTGRGTVTVSNSGFRLTLSEAAGGTATDFISTATGTNYGHSTFGVNYGRFSRHDPKLPRTNTVEYLDERKVHQFETPGALRLAEQGPARVIVEATWSDANLSASQRYEFYAYQPFFRVVSKATPRNTTIARSAREIVALDGRFRAGKLSKSYPNFVGVRKDEPQPHFGWRYGNWIPPYTTFMTPNAFEESLSLIPLGVRGVDQIRQGFWPRRRPKAGLCELAQVELVSTAVRPVELHTVVFLHPGHQVAAKQLRYDLSLPPKAAAPEWFEWTGGSIAANHGDGNWHHPLFDRRVEVTIRLPAGVEHETVEIGPPLPGRGAIGSVAVTEVGPRGESLGDRPSLWQPDTRLVAWRAQRVPDRTSRYYVYLSDRTDLLALPGHPRVLPEFSELQTQHFESAEAEATWDLAGGAIHEGDGHSGNRSVRVTCRRVGAPAVIVNRSLAPQPQARYRLTYWAKALTEPCTVRANFFADVAHDFAQRATAVPKDGKWHKYEITLATGDFPPHVRPRLRLWVLGGNETVLLDDVAAKLAAGASRRRLVVEIGRLEHRTAPRTAESE